jgi:hypothetical protein
VPCGHFLKRAKRASSMQPCIPQKLLGNKVPVKKKYQIGQVGVKIGQGRVKPGQGYQKNGQGGVKPGQGGVKYR